MAEPSTDQTERTINGAAEKIQADVAQAADGLLNGDLEATWPIIENYVIPAGLALFALLLGYFVAALLSRLTSAPIRKRVDETVGRFAGRVVFYSILLCTILGVLGSFGISVASFAAVIAAAGFAVGLAFQGTLSNFASGVLLLVFRPFKVGDVVSAAGLTAIVGEIDLFTTTFNTFDNRRVIVPNSEIAGSTIENITFYPERRIDLQIGVSYSADIEQTRATLTRAVEKYSNEVVQGESRGYQIMLLELGSSSVDWVVRVWTKAETFWPLREKLLASIKNELDAAEIDIPFPQMDVHLDVPDGQVQLKAVS